MTKTNAYAEQEKRNIRSIYSVAMKVAGNIGAGFHHGDYSAGKSKSVLCL